MADAYLYRFDAEQAASVLESAVRLQPQNVSSCDWNWCA